MKKLIISWEFRLATVFVHFRINTQNFSDIQGVYAKNNFLHTFCDKNLVSNLKWRIPLMFEQESLQVQSLLNLNRVKDPGKNIKG